MPSIILPETVRSSKDLLALEKGGYMYKLTSEKKLKKRFYRFDFSKNELRGTSKKIMSSEQTFPFNKLNEVKKGLATEDVKLIKEDLVNYSL